MSSSLDLMHLPVEVAQSEFGGRVFAARVHRALTQDELAEALAHVLGRPFAASAVHRIERGARPTTVTELIALCQVLSVEPAGLLSDTPFNCRQEWEYLADCLIRRRVDLGFPRRSEWFRHLNVDKERRVIEDIENARRTNYAATSLILVEQWYEWAPGSVATVLDGGAPSPR